MQRRGNRVRIRGIGRGNRGPAPGSPDDARALARLQLTRIDSRARRALEGGGTLGDYTRSHLLETRARIDQAFTAEREAPRGPGGPGGPAAQPE